MTPREWRAAVRARHERETCGCRPGTYDDGWQEKRCEACERAEIAALGQVAAWINGNRIAREKR